MKKFIVAFLCAVVFGSMIVISSCKKDKDDDNVSPSGSNKVTFDLTHKVGAFVLDMAAGSYTNAAGNTYTVSKFRYYISNISFTKKDGTIYTVPVNAASSENYFLVDEADDNSKTLTINNVPAGDYTQVSFLIGIDSLRNVSGAQSGSLDPLKDMFWDWNMGYIFLKMEGNSSAAPGAGDLTYHIGGFSGVNNTLRNVSISLAAENITVRSNIAPEIHLMVDLAKLFEGTHTIDFSSLSACTIPGADAMKLADNYKNMFSLDHVHNEVQ